MNKYLAFSFGIILFIAGTGVGFAFTPEYQQMRRDKTNGMMELGNADATIDLRYIDGMIAHHMSAIYMLDQAKRESKRTEIQSLAAAIIDADTKGIEKLYSYKKQFFGNTRKVSVFTRTNLGTADEAFDLRFLNAMILHHNEAIAKAKEIMAKSTRKEILTLADETITALSANRVQLIEWRKAWYGVEGL